MDEARHRTTKTELLGMLWLCGQLTQAGVETASPARDTGIDLISYDLDVNWVVPIQLKVINTGGVRVEAKYLGKTLALIYLLLGARDGGPANRADTSAYLLTPEQAWALPVELGRKFSPDDHLYYNCGLPRLLLARLARYRVQPAEWATRLQEIALRWAQEGPGGEDTEAA